MAYLCYWINFQNSFLNQLRKCLACLSTAALVLFLGAQVGQILSVVYRVDYGEEMAFAVKMILMLSNMEGNLELCTQKYQHKQVVMETQPVSNV